MSRGSALLLLLGELLLSANAFTLSTAISKVGQRHSSFLGAVKIKERVGEPVGMSMPNKSSALLDPECFPDNDSKSLIDPVATSVRLASIGAASLLTASTLLSQDAHAISMPKELTLSSGSFDPSSFVPVCPASDGLYRVFQGSAKTIVGADNFQEYGPLIASGLLRVRLELCVVESFFNEAVGPFIRQNGLSWVLPIHETVETFLAGTVFALATTFILVGSTKILTVIFTYADFLVGSPLRILGGFAFDRARGKPVVLDIGLGPFKTRVIGPKDVDVEKEDDWSVDVSEVSPAELAVIVVSGGAKAAGTVIKVCERRKHEHFDVPNFFSKLTSTYTIIIIQVLREILDAIDLFVGKSLVLWVTAYIGFKFIHFKVFPDFPPF